MFCREGIEKDFWQINWEAITVTFALNGGLSMANKQYHGEALKVFTSPFNTENIIRLLLEVKL